MIYGVADYFGLILVIKNAVNVAVARIVLVNYNTLKRPAGIKSLFVNFGNACADINCLKLTVAVKGKFVYRRYLFALVIDNAVVYLVSAAEERVGVRSVVVKRCDVVNGKADYRAVVRKLFKPIAAVFKAVVFKVARVEKRTHREEQ